MKYFILLLLALVLAPVAGCQAPGGNQVPPGYDADTTPDHNGELWIGGAP